MVYSAPFFLSENYLNSEFVIRNRQLRLRNRRLVYASLARAIELDEFLDVRIGREFRVFEDLFDGLRAVQILVVDDAVREAERFDIIRREAFALERDHIDHLGADIFRAFDDHVRRNVLNDAGAGCEHRIVTDAAELVNARAPAEIDVVAANDVAGKSRLRAHDEVVADDAVVRDVRVGENVVIVAERRPFAFLRAAVNGYVFAEDVAVADFRADAAAVMLQVLRLPADNGKGENFVVFTHDGVAFDTGVVVNNRSRAERDFAADVGVGSDFDIFSELRARLNNSSGMNHCVKRKIGVLKKDESRGLAGRINCPDL